MRIQRRNCASVEGDHSFAKSSRGVDADVRGIVADQIYRSNVSDMLPKLIHHDSSRQVHESTLVDSFQTRFWIHLHLKFEGNRYRPYILQRGFDVLGCVDFRKHEPDLRLDIRDHLPSHSVEMPLDEDQGHSELERDDGKYEDQSRSSEYASRQEGFAVAMFHSS